MNPELHYALNPMGTSPSYDKSLIKLVHDERLGRYRITAFLTRFGGLSVFVDDCESDTMAIWQGENILEAREIARANVNRAI